MMPQTTTLASPYHDEQGRPRPVPAPPPKPAPTDQPAAQTEPAGNQRSRERARKEAAPHRTKERREEADKALAESVDRIAGGIAQSAADPPGCPSARLLLETARANGLEAQLYRQAQIIRAAWKPSDWTATLRLDLDRWLKAAIATQPTTKKGQPK